MALALGLSLAPGAGLGAPPRFVGRLQVLSGAGVSFPPTLQGGQRVSAYVPLDVELALRASGSLSVLVGGVAGVAPGPPLGCGPDRRQPHALAAYGGLRLDLNNSRRGSWLSPYVALRAGLVGQDGVPGVGPAPEPGSLVCVDRFSLGVLLSPRAGLDLWLGQAAATFAVGYDVLPGFHAAVALVGLTLRLL